MTATDELRRLLDERGVEWWEPVQTEGSVFTRWNIDGVSWTASMVHGRDNVLRIGTNTVTPAQAVEATLGRHAIISDNLAESEGTGDAWANCSECGHLLFVLTDPTSNIPNYCPNCGRKVNIKKTTGEEQHGDEYQPATL